MIKMKGINDMFRELEEASENDILPKPKDVKRSFERCFNTDFENNSCKECFYKKERFCRQALWEDLIWLMHNNELKVIIQEIKTDD